MAYRLFTVCFAKDTPVAYGVFSLFCCLRILQWRIVCSLSVSQRIPQWRIVCSLSVSLSKDTPVEYRLFTVFFAV